MRFTKSFQIAALLSASATRGAWAETGADSVGAIPPPDSSAIAIAPLGTALTDTAATETVPRDERRAAALAELEDAAEADARPMALSLLDHPDAARREAALTFLRRFEDPAGAADSLLHDPDASVRLAALRAADEWKRDDLIRRALSDTSRSVVNEAIEIVREKSIGSAAIELQALAFDPERPGALRTKAIELLTELSQIHIIRFLAGASVEDQILEIARLRWGIALADEVKVYRSVRSFLTNLIDGKGNSAYLLLTPEAREGLTPDKLTRSSSIRSFRISSVNRLGPDDFEVDVRVIVESTGGEQLFLRTDYLVLERREGRFLLRRRVLGGAVPLG
ncbi:MAG: hypothetical protein CME06_12745 [Gemmatimonadetes bacterium]|nr:hypothetical protein [Gemmatimonadota bacterium]